MLQPNRPQMTVWRMRIACWIPNTTNTHPEYVILIAFLLQQWLHENVSMLRYTYMVYIYIYIYMVDIMAPRYILNGTAAARRSLFLFTNI